MGDCNHLPVRKMSVGVERFVIGAQARTVDDVAYVGESLGGKYRSCVLNFPPDWPQWLRDRWVESTRQMLREQLVIDVRMANLYLAEAPAPDVHQTWEWTQTRSGSAERTQAMLDALGLRALRDRVPVLPLDIE